jgi:hypothetical protein
MINEARMKEIIKRVGETKRIDYLVNYDALVNTAMLKFKWLAKGGSSDVYELDDNLVLKVFGYDIGAIAWAEHCHTQPNLNAHYPRIVETQWINGVYVATMERLEPCRGMLNHIRLIADDMYAYFISGECHNTMQNKEFVEIAEDISKICILAQKYDVEIGMDIHQLNLMLRQDGTLVFNDPIT